jgi:hypothetical protein
VTRGDAQQELLAVGRIVGASGDFRLVLLAIALELHVTVNIA